MSAAVAKLSDKKTTHGPKYKEKTLEDRFGDAAKFAAKHPIGSIITTDAFDLWCVEAELMDSSLLNEDASPAEQNYRVIRRNAIREHLSLGGKCANFDESQKFEVRINEHGKSIRVVALASSVSEDASNVGVAMQKRIANLSRGLEKKISTFDFNKMPQSLIHRIRSSRSALRSFKMTHDGAARALIMSMEELDDELLLYGVPKPPAPEQTQLQLLDGRNFVEPKDDQHEDPDVENKDTFGEGI